MQTATLIRSALALMTGCLYIIFRYSKAIAIGTKHRGSRNLGCPVWHFFQLEPCGFKAHGIVLDDPRNYPLFFGFAKTKKNKNLEPESLMPTHHDYSGRHLFHFGPQPRIWSLSVLAVLRVFRVLVKEFQKNQKRI